MKRLYAAEITALLWLLFVASCSKGMEEPRNEKEAPPVEVTAEVDRATATTGDAIRYTLTAKSIPQIEVAIPEMGAQIAGLRIVDMGETGPLERDGHTIIQKWYKLKADLVGSYIIPGAVFSYLDAAGKKKELKTAQIFIEVKTVIDDKDAATDIRDIKPLAVIPRDYTRILWLSLAGLALLILAAGGIYLYRTRHRTTPPPSLRPAHELALEEIDQLQKEGLLTQGIYQEHYFKLSEIFRRYLERRFNFQAIEQTTEEIVPELHNLNGIDEKTKDKAQQFLHHTDLVKFAKHIPEPEEVEHEHREAIDFIHQTKEEPGNGPTPSTTQPQGENR